LRQLVCASAERALSPRSQTAAMSVERNLGRPISLGAQHNSVQCVKFNEAFQIS